MKRIAFQLIASSVALVVMAGAVGVHWWGLEISGDLKPGSRWHVLSVPREIEGGMVPVSTGGPGSRGVQVGHSDVNPMTVSLFQEMIETLQTIQDQNQTMRDENERLEEQLREINGELNGMQIRFDGLDNEFRPLEVAPMREGVIDSGNPLLPPKRW